MSKFKILVPLALSALAYAVSEGGFWYSLFNLFTGSETLVQRLIYPPLFAYLAIYFVGLLKNSIAQYRAFGNDLAGEVHDE
jgi:hypothetical protein